MLVTTSFLRYTKKSMILAFKPQQKPLKFLSASILYSTIRFFNCAYILHWKMVDASDGDIEVLLSKLSPEPTLLEFIGMRRSKILESKSWLFALFCGFRAKCIANYAQPYFIFGNIVSVFFLCYGVATSDLPNGTTNKLLLSTVIIVFQCSLTCNELIISSVLFTKWRGPTDQVYQEMDDQNIKNVFRRHTIFISILVFIMVGFEMYLFVFPKIATTGEYDLSTILLIMSLFSGSAFNVAVKGSALLQVILDCEVDLMELNRLNERRISRTLTVEDYTRVGAGVKSRGEFAYYLYGPSVLLVFAGLVSGMVLLFLRKNSSIWIIFTFCLAIEVCYVLMVLFSIARVNEQSDALARDIISLDAKSWPDTPPSIEPCRNELDTKLATNSKTDEESGEHSIRLITSYFDKEMNRMRLAITALGHPIHVPSFGIVWTRNKMYLQFAGSLISVLLFIGKLSTG